MRSKVLVVCESSEKIRHEFVEKGCTITTVGWVPMDLLDRVLIGSVLCLLSY